MLDTPEASVQFILAVKSDNVAGTKDLKNPKLALHARTEDGLTDTGKIIEDALAATRSILISRTRALTKWMAPSRDNLRSSTPLQPPRRMASAQCAR